MSPHALHVTGIVGLLAPLFVFGLFAPKEIPGHEDDSEHYDSSTNESIANLLAESVRVNCAGTTRDLQA